MAGRPGYLEPGQSVKPCLGDRFPPADSTEGSLSGTAAASRAWLAQGLLLEKCQGLGRLEAGQHPLPPLGSLPCGTQAADLSLFCWLHSGAWAGLNPISSFLLSLCTLRAPSIFGTPYIFSIFVYLTSSYTVSLRASTVLSSLQILTRSLSVITTVHSGFSHSPAPPLWGPLLGGWRGSDGNSHSRSSFLPRDPEDGTVLTQHISRDPCHCCCQLPLFLKGLENRSPACPTIPSTDTLHGDKGL